MVNIGRRTLVIPSMPVYKEDERAIARTVTAGLGRREA